MDNPAGIDVRMATATVHMKNQSFLDTDHLFGSPTLDFTIRTGGFPVATIMSQADPNEPPHGII